MGEIFMPKMGDAMTEGKVVRWYKQPGDAVKKGEPVLEIETDKVNLDLESEEDGVLDEIQVQEGQMAPVGATLATTKGNGAGAAKRPATGGEEAKKKPRTENVEEEPAAETKREDSPQKPARPPAQQQQAPAQQQRAHLRAVETPPPSSGAKGVRSSPLARKMAREMGVDLG